MEIVTVIKKDETSIQITCPDSGVIMEIAEHFTFYADGYKYHPLVKSKQWDGRICLVNRRNNTMPYGLLEDLTSFCEVRGYGVNRAGLTLKNVPSEESLIEYINSIPLSTRGKKIEFRDYQTNGFVNAIQNKRSLTISPTGSGKSALIYMMVRWFLDHHEDDKMVLIVVPTTALVSQMKKDFADYSEFDSDFDANKEVHEIYSGKEKHNFASRVVVTTWQSAVKLEKRWFQNFGMVIGDEAHGFVAKSLNTIMGNLVNADYRIGTTGTVDNTKCNKLVLIGNFGPIHRVTTTKELMDADTLAQLKINCLVLVYSDELKKIVSKLDYQSEIDFIVAHEGRNRFITNLAISLKGNTLVLFNYVEKHGKPLHKLISSKAAEGRKVFYVSGEVDTDSREKIREITETETDAIIVASLGTFSLGTNLRNLHNVLFAAPSKSQIRVLQSIGRGLRKSDNGEPTTLYDISDNFAWKKKKNYTLNHAVSRVNIYEAEKFEYKMFEIPIT